MSVVVLERERRFLEKAEEIINQFGNNPGHVFNLGHGIHQHVDPDHLGVLIDAVHEFGTAIRS